MNDYHDKILKLLDRLEYQYLNELDTTNTKSALKLINELRVAVLCDLWD